MATTVLLAWCLVLLAYRIHLSDRPTYSFLAWNLFLAWVPLALSGLLRRRIQAKSPGFPEAAICGLWILFFPNAPYVITDLVHLRPRPSVPLWYDLGLLLSCGAAGLAMGFLSLREVQLVLARRWGTARSWGFAVAVLFLAAFGVYVGRYLRWNSWDVVVAPWDLLTDVSHRLLDPASFPRTLGVTLLFGVLLNLGYFFLSLWSRPGDSDVVFT